MRLHKNLQLVLYGVALGLLILALKLMEYHFLIMDHAMEIYSGLLALLFTAVGLWAGLRIIRSKKEVVVVKETVEVEREVPAPVSFVLNEDLIRQLGISKREHEVLQLMAAGLSNQEIADRLFVSLNTVKTHSSKIFEKLEVSRRTQAVQKAKSLQIIA